MDLESFENWLLVERGFREKSAGKAKRDLATYLRNPERARNPTTRKRARDYVWTWTLYQQFKPGAELFHADGSRAEAPTLPARVSEGRGRKKSRRLDTFSIEPGEWGKLKALIAADTSPQGRVLAVMVKTGLRVGDVLRVPRAALVKAFARADGIVALELKTGKEEISTVKAAEREWLLLYNALKQKNAKTVQAATGKSADSAYMNVRNAFMKHCKAARVSGRHNLHRIRHTISIELRRAGVPIEDVQVVLGHSNLATTQIYLSEFQGEIVRKALQRLG